MRELQEILQAMLAQKDKIKNRHELLLDMAERVVKAVSQEFGCKQEEVAILLVSLDGRHLRFVAPRLFAELGTIPTTKRDSIAVGVLSRKTGEVINNVPMVKHITFFESIKLKDKPIPIQKMVTTPLLVKGAAGRRRGDQPQGRDRARRRSGLHCGRPAPRPGDLRRGGAASGRGASARLLADPTGGPMRARRGAVALAFLGLIVVLESRAPLGAEAPAFPLTVESIMRGPDLVGYPPSDLRWSGDSKELFFEWRQPGEDEPATWVVSREAGEPRRLSDEERRRAPSPGCEWDLALRRCLAIQEGDVVLVDTVARTRRVLAGSTAAESSPRFTARESAVSYVRDNNLFRLALAGDGDVLVQLTDVAPKKKEPKLTESQQFLKDEERKLLKQVDEAVARRKRAEDRKEKLAPPRLEIAEGQSVSEGTLSGDGRFAFLLVVQKAEGAKTADVPSYVTESAYVESLPARTNVGDKQDSRRLVVMDLQERKNAWAFVDGVTEPEPAKQEDAKAGGATKQELAKGEEAKPETAAEKKPAGRDVRFGLPVISPGGTRAVAAVRAADSKDRWLVLVDPATGKARVLDRQHDDAWVRELGAPSFGWVDDRTLWFLSEATGFAHLYTLDVSAESSAAKAITSGAWEVLDVKLSPKRDAFYLTTSEIDAGERQAYRVARGGGERTRLSSTEGAHQIEVSPDEATLADLFSDASHPPEVLLLPARGGGAGRQVTTSTRPAFRSFAWTKPAVVRFKARDGVAVPARLFTPQSVGAQPDPRRPAVVFIHGAGYLQNAHRYWSSYFREYMFHHLLASRGYFVLDVDYRGSAGYGRDWRTAIAGHMGGKDLDDIVDGAAYLVAEHGVDPKRIGVYGGSYGGFLTLMALFTSPDTFAAGAALRPVTDWAHYNHPYTSNILGQPPKDADAFRKSSPLYFAEGLKGALLICHGVVDTNVHFQDSVRLAQRLIELGKEDWELAAYPVENHGFVEASSWTDEYRRILALFERKLRT